MQPQQKTGLTSLQQIGIAWAVVITVLVAIIVAGNLAFSHSGSPSSTGVLSDAPVTTCAGASSNYFPLAPGTLIAMVQGRHVTHFYRDQPFQLVYTGDTGDSFAPQQVGVDAYPNFDGATHVEDADSAYLPVSAQDIHGTTLTASVLFPFTAPKFPNVYTKSGPYCFAFDFAYTRPDGVTLTVVAFIGLVEEPANTTQSQ